MAYLVLVAIAVVLMVLGVVWAAKGKDYKKLLVVLVILALFLSSIACGEVDGDKSKKTPSPTPNDSDLAEDLLDAGRAVRDGPGGIFEKTEKALEPVDKLINPPTPTPEK
jgi:hypothetical protein